MNGITVQLVFAFVGTRVPYFMPETTTTASSPVHSPFGNAPPVSFNAAIQSSVRADSTKTSPNMAPCPPPNLFTAQGLLNRLAKSLEPPPYTVATSESATIESASSSPTVPPPSHKPPVFELFDYASLDPLESTAVLYDEQVLLVLCDIATTAQLVEALQLKWLEVYSGAHHPHHHNRPAPTLALAPTTDMAVCTTEEKLRNVAHAQQALCKPVALHLSLLKKELVSREVTLAALKEQLSQLRSFASASNSTVASSAEGGGDCASSPTLPDRVASFPLLMELEPSLASEPAPCAADAVHLQKVEAPLALCEARVRAVETLMQRAAKHHTKLLELTAGERATEEAFESGEVSRACAEYLERAEQDRSTAEAIIAGYQVEMSRQLKVVRQLVAYTTQVRRLVSKAKYDMSVVDLILSRLLLTGLRPRLMEEAEALLCRRVILRRAARRQMLLLQETEFVDLHQDLEAFSQRTEVQKVLPEKVRWYLRAPLPSLMPEEDPVATLLDHALIDRDKDEAQELVEKTRVLYTADPSDPAKNALRITEALLPVERLARRLEEARASAAQYKSRMEELEEKLKVYEVAGALSSPQLQDSVVKSPSTESPGEGASFEGSERVLGQN
ncbi:hypothetical protein GH5_00531 [Leishmania sp. Ghana 2012 LV757]|uniref:hypothetical protein n=1 Tax=Leishmania sp. Ghana 2012 LV757 TaxID=2803181 RepID=UPI001B5372D4|nr:hypothetical protein GH5_00531 [Leishmania sp. Ghana 2012 LV757]